MTPSALSPAVRPSGLDPIAAPVPLWEQAALPPVGSATGDGWEGGWAAAAVPREARRWRDGWDVTARCPPDPKDVASPAGKRGWRELGTVGGTEHREQHDKRRRAVRRLREAGYVARGRWAREENGVRRHGRNEVPSFLYSEGPAKGREAIDPWKEAANMAGCGRVWNVTTRIRKDGTLTTLPVPRRCGREHLCPVCASLRSSALAAAVRAVVIMLHGTDPAACAMVTFTQRDSTVESLGDALDRLNLGWDLMTRGRAARKWWLSLVEGWYIGVEVTRGAEGKKGGQGKWWHAHLHVVLRFQPGVDEATAREAIAAAWQRCSEEAAVTWGLPGHGWDPVPARILNEDTGGERWWRTIDPTSPREVYQACKYPTPIVELHPVALAEFVSVAFMRKWHRGGGSLSRVLSDAEELLDTGAVIDEEAVDLGEPLHNPRHGPELDTVAPDVGWSGAAPEAPQELLGDALYPLSDSVDLDAVRSAATDVRGSVETTEAVFGDSPPRGWPRGGWILRVPREWVRAELLRVEAALRPGRQRREEALARLRELRKGGQPT